VRRINFFRDLNGLFYGSRDAQLGTVSQGEFTGGAGNRSKRIACVRTFESKVSIKSLNLRPMHVIQ
jgi:hypothetical protein